MISDRAKALLEGRERATPRDIAELLTAIRGVEALALSRSVEIASNGRFPRWGFDRWWRVGVGLIAVLGWIWVASARWTTVETAANQVAAVQSAVDALAGDVKTNREITDRRLEQLSDQVAAAATEARNAARAAAVAAWNSSGRGRGGHP